MGLAALFSLGVNLLALANLHGVADPNGFLLNTSKLFVVNTIEEDGAINVFAGLGYFTDYSSRFAYYINLGGPFLHLGRLVLSLAEKLGLIVRFPDPWLYLWHPQALVQVWQAYGAYKLVLFLSLAPLAVHWFCANHIDRPTGVTAAWLFAAMPFIVGFELRLKADTPAIVLALFALLCLLQWLKHGERRHFLLASTWFALSLSIKLVAVPLGILFLAALAARVRREPGPAAFRSSARLALSGLLLGAAVFVAANPLVVPGLGAFFSALRESPVFLALPAVDRDPSTVGFGALFRRLTHMDVYYGPFCNLLVLPGLAWAVAHCLRNRMRLDAVAALLATFATGMAYLLVVAWQFMGVAYYFFFPAVLLLLLLAAAMTTLVRRLARAGRLASLGGWLAVAAAVLTCAVAQGRVLGYLLGPTNGEAAHAWIARTLPAEASIGVLLDGPHELANTFYRVDPFRFRVVPVGKDGERAARIGPDYLLRAAAAPGAAVREFPGYDLVAAFDRGMGIHRESHSLFQEEPYHVYKRREPNPAIDQALPGGMERALGAFVSADPEPAFAVAQFQALALFPISLDVFRKEPGAMLPLPPRLLGASARHASSPLAYVHQVDSTTLTLWGVKYLLAKLDPEAGFPRDTLESGRFRLQELARYRLASGDAPNKTVGLYRNAGYRGQAFFTADPRPGEEVRLAPTGIFGRRPVPGFGRFYDREALLRLRADVLEVRMDIDADGPVDVVFKGAKARRSLLVDAGSHRLAATYEIDADAQEAGYEVNPANPGARFTIRSITARPLRIDTGPVAEETSVSMKACFARVRAPEAGRVLLAVPYHPFWEARLDGGPAAVERGPADTVAVNVPPGEHFVSVTSFLGTTP